MNIAIYCGRNPGPAVDATNLEKGNPGVGGTQYVMLLLAHYLSQDPKYNVSVLSVRPYFLGGGDSSRSPVTAKWSMRASACGRIS